MSISVHAATLISSVSAAAAVVAVIVSLWLGHKQRELQLRLSLFDKRLAVFRATEGFLNSVLKADGSINLSVDYTKFQYVIEEAQFLFPDDSNVMPYLTDVKEKAKKLYVIRKKQDAAAAKVAPEDDPLELIAYFGEPARRRRVEVFSPHLKVGKV
jgi:ABC-type uncharacterized transport system YnjBCD permease subunit